MSHLIFRLRNVPEEEAKAVRQLFDDHHIEYFETTAGNWGISMPGLWLKNENDTAQASALLDQFQRDYQKAAQETYQQQVRRGDAPNFFQVVKDRPFLVLLVISFCLFIVYVSTQPFLKLMQQ